ncbi:hypothetical protein GCM10025768_27890 [Microbacterium pseudoresistens]|uniref:Uncharacterized protein n=1 Tax=Microbacterium pseudoresistens TaxID=640634 RepID=A0A7Y9JNG4_9MICO|nr:hypothetical protein [Microbacterium pseudoresistens]NYD53679.1 hypothetical protein [Microbacterium pseudoresistens]
MILAGLILLCVGIVDIVRRFVPPRTRWYAFAGGGLALIIVGAIANAAIPAILAVGVAALWAAVVSPDGRSRLSFWPAVLLAALCAGAVAFGPARADAGVFGTGWRFAGMGGQVSFDLVVLAVGAFAMLLETGNVIVRAALLSEHAVVPVDVVADGDAPEAGSEDAPPVDQPPAEAPPAEVSPAGSIPADGFRGGRLIGPLERVIVLLLTLASAYPLLAAMLAAKGIVRFPEISRDGGSGARAEYFLVGSLVSWVVALGAAFLVWWGAAS